MTTVTDEVGEISNNAQMDCVAASVDAYCRYLLGQPENSIFNPDAFKDASYGDAYTGGTSAEAYIAFCKSLGVTLSPIDTASPQAAIAEAHTLIQQGKPVLFTMIDPYVDTNLPQYANWTHVCVWMAEDTGVLTAMDPYIARAVYKSDATWASLLRSNQLWVAEKIQEESLTINLSIPEVAVYFQAGPNPNAWLCKSNNKVIQYGILSFYVSFGNSGLCGLTYLGLPLTDEIPIESLPPGYPQFAGHGIVVQFYERGSVIYDPQHLVSNPPGSGGVYLLSVSQGPGQLPVIAQLQSQIAALQKELGTGSSTYSSAINQIKQIVAPL